MSQSIMDQPFPIVFPAGKEDSWDGMVAAAAAAGAEPTIFECFPRTFFYKTFLITIGGRQHIEMHISRYYLVINRERLTRFGILPDCPSGEALPDSKWISAIEPKITLRTIGAFLRFRDQRRRLLVARRHRRES